MVRWAILLSVVSLVAFLVATVQAPPPPPPQPIRFSHERHMEYFAEGRHRQEMLSMHEVYLGDLVFESKELRCEMCHGGFEEAARETPRIRYCAGCHETFRGRDWSGRQERKPCMGCHRGAVDSPRASIPNVETCRACHIPVRTGGAEERKLLAYFEEEQKIPWARVYDYLPGDIVFSHERHAQIGGIPCRECHGDVERAQKPLWLEVKLSMEDCMGCHERSGANNDCLGCHK